VTKRSEFSVLLIGFEDQDNLGLRYLLSSVRRAGFAGRIATYTSDPAPIVEIAAREKPDVVGFSLIFQYMSPAFGRVIERLRESGCGAHIVIGGHYPSFDFQEVLQRIPGADSIARFEGEGTLVELMSKLCDGGNWRDVAGLAYRRNNEIVSNALRPALDDLDELPYPERGDIDYRGQDVPTASIIGSRGCPWNCSFCSIRPFYEAQGGKLRRLRAPASIAEEMRVLHVEKGARIFLFQDDDFLATGRRGRNWAEDLADEIVAAGLKGRIAFKISCRSDEIRYDNMARLAEAGLTHVYMGVENGDEEGLVHLNKQLKPDRHLAAGDVLRRLDMSFDFGFMLLEPYSTFDTVRNNIAFLDRFVGDGATVAGFCRTLPYAGTPLKRQLEKEGRLLGTPFEPDYGFLDPKLDLFYDWMLLTFRERNFDNAGLNETLRSMLFEAHLKLPGLRAFQSMDRTRIHSIAAQANGHALYCLGAALDYIEATPLASIDIRSGFLAGLTAHELTQERELEANLATTYWGALARQEHGSTRQRVVGGFGNSWTLAEQDLSFT